MSSDYQVPDLHRRGFARTNPQTIIQRARLLRELAPGVTSIAEICCGDCSQQRHLYTELLGIQRFSGLDIDPAIVALNRQAGIECLCGDALDSAVLRSFLGFDVLFYGPPLSVGCDGHQSLAFQDVRPSYADLLQLLVGELRFDGLMVCICPKTTTWGDIRQLYQQARGWRPGLGLRLIHYSHATVTGGGEETELRLKYVELWFSAHLGDLWEVRESEG